MKESCEEKESRVTFRKHRVRSNSAVGYFFMFGKCFTLSLLLVACFIAARGNCSNIRKVDFRNHIYPLREPGFTHGTKLLRVINGRYEEPHDNPPNLAFLDFEIVGIAFGDLDRD